MQVEGVDRLVTDGAALDAVTRYPDVYTPPLQDEVQPRQCVTLLYVHTPVMHTMKHDTTEECTQLCSEHAG